MPPIIGRSTEGRDIRINVERLIVSRLLISATSGQGKSWTIRRLLEQTHGQIQQIVLDVEGEFFSLREKFDYVLAGGADGDCPADVRCAAMLARKLLELRVSCIVDIYELTMKDRIHFVKLFLESMINAPKSLWHPVMVVVDECQLFAPQDAKCESTQAVVDLMTRGRKRGYVGALCTLRPAALDANVRATALNKLIGGLSLDIDVERSGKDLGFSRNRWGELRALKPGHFFAIGPALCDKVTEITVGSVVTTHPKAGQQAMTPPPPREAVKKVLASLADLPAEAERELQTVEELKARVKTLEAEARKATPAADLRAMEQRHAEVVRRYQTAAKRAVEMLANVPQAIEATREFIAPIAGEDAPTVLTDDHIPRPMIDALRKRVSSESDMDFIKRKVAQASNGHKRESADTSVGPRKILIAIAQYPNVTTDTLAVMTGYKATSRRIYLQKLVSDGLAMRDGKTFVITDAGLAELGTSWKPLPTGDKLREHWMLNLPEGERKILGVVIDSYPRTIAPSALADATGYKATSIRIYSQKLVSRRLLVREHRELKAARELFG